MKLFFLFCLLFAFVGCVSYDDFDTSKPAGAYGLGKQLEDDDRFEEALTQYRDVKNRFPYSQFAIEAELRMAEVYFKKETYPEAQSAYQVFKELHPRHEKIDYVTFQIGESIFKQLPTTIDRDLALAPIAMKDFEVLIRDYPKSHYVDEAQKRINEIVDMLAQKELYIADFYFRTEKWQSALVRYEKYLQEFPVHKARPRALLRAGISADHFGDPNKKNLLLRRLIKEYPQSKEAKKAKEEL